MTDFNNVWTRENNPIREELNSRLASPGGDTTYAMRQALAGANKAFVEEISRDMSLLMAGIKDPQLRYDLMNEQKEWSEYHDASTKFINDSYSKSDSDSAKMTADNLQFDLVERRALDLHGRLFKREGSN